MKITENVQKTKIVTYMLKLELIHLLKIINKR